MYTIEMVRIVCSQEAMEKKTRFKFQTSNLDAREHFHLVRIDELCEDKLGHEATHVMDSMLQR